MSDKRNRRTKKQKEEVVETTEEAVVEEVVVDQALLDLLASYDPKGFKLGNGEYRLVKEYREGFDYETLIKRYTDILEKYDYIVGDWGYDQLRLKGFFKDDFKSAPIDAKISTLEDYLYEYCNFGCAYFVIEQTGEFKRRGRSNSSNAKKKPHTPNNKGKNPAHVSEKRYDTNKPKRKPKYNQQASKSKKQGPAKKETPKETSQKKTSNQNRHFTIKQKDNS